MHLELVKDLSAPTFTRSLRRFTARRWAPALIISGNLKTFKATKRFMESLHNDNTVKNFLLIRRIKWHFNLELSPWQRGMFERLIGSTKRCLPRALGSARLTYDESSTILIEVEAILNARPLAFIR